MSLLARSAAGASLTLAAFVFSPSVAFAQTFGLDPSSTSLGIIPATAADLLAPSGALPPSAAPPPAVTITTAELGLLPGDVIDAMSFFDDSFPGPGTTMFFSVDRGTAGLGVVAAPDVTGENIAFVPPATQGEAASDLFVSNDLSCVPFGAHTQILDGDGALLGPPSFCGYGGGAPLGIGLAEGLPLGPPPPPPFTDDLENFDWGVIGRGRLFCIVMSLAPGSPTLTPGSNPLLPAGAEPADILVSCPSNAPAVSTPTLFAGLTAAAMGLVSGGPGCAPPVCDDIDALSSSNFSLSPASPSVPGFAPGDVLSPGPVLLLPAAALGLGIADNVDALEATTNLCPVPPGADAPDFDGVGACDNCPGLFNLGQEDTDGDGIGDVCDPCTDIDGDGFGNMGFPNLCSTDLCPFFPGPNIDTDGDGWADECDNCPLVANTDLADAELDGIGNVCDVCPNVFGAIPSPFVAGSVKKAQLGFKNNGPGTGDDSAKTGGAFATALPIDFDSVDSMIVTLTNTTTGAALSTTSMPAGVPWSQPNPAKLAWKYSTAAAPFVKAQAKESPTGSMTYKWKARVKTISLPGPQIAPATDDILVALEIPTQGLCFNATLTTCASTPLKKDSCKP